jgi:GSCFA family
MAVRIKDLADDQLLGVYDTYLQSDTANWTVGVGLLTEISRRFGARHSRDSYLAGLRRVVAIKPSLKGREEKFFPPDFVITLPELKRLVDDLTKDVCLAAVENISVPQLAGTLRYEVPIMADLARYGEQVDALLGQSKSIFKHMQDRRLLTFGSCFAVNIGRLLRDKGASVYTMVIAEDVNSPFNNLQLLKRVFLGERTAISEELMTISGIDYEALRGEFERATDIIFTLGNIYHLELDGTATVLTNGGAVVVAETIEETVASLKGIFALLREHTKAKLFTSVSPIPISGYRGPEFASAIEADCASKSQLRAALNGCLKEFPDLHYIPTFEVFRWLPAHQAFATFGTDDGQARHISGKLLKRVLDSIAG